PVLKGLAIPVRVVTPIRQQVLCGRQAAQKRPRADVIAALAGGEEHPHGAAERIRNGVQLGVQAALRAPDQAAPPPFLSPRLEAVRCALRWVASIISVSVPPPRSASSSSIRAKMPFSLQRFQRL